MVKTLNDMEKEVVANFDAINAFNKYNAQEDQYIENIPQNFVMFIAKKIITMRSTTEIEPICNRTPTIRPDAKAVK
uniref:Uncharacterized protein n=1 Tax=Glossina brevipalpis TaxID=37001 RepID=A0A1A9WR15_9MUSC